METTYSQIKRAQAELATEFGVTLRRWRVSNGWTQYTIRNWAAETGIEAIAHSGLSEIERGLTKDPRVSFYVALEAVNRLVAAQDFKGVTTRKLLDQLKGSRAICHDDGTPWGAGDFWELRAGLRQAPEWLAPVPVTPAPVLSPAQIEELCEQWADQARQAARRSGAGRAGLERARSHAPAKERDRWADVLAGLHTYSAEELAELWDPEASEWRPEQWLAAWRSTLPTPLGGGD